MTGFSQQHDAIWAVELFNELVADGASSKELLLGTRLHASDLKREALKVPFESVARLFENAAHMTGDDTLGFKFGQTRNFKRAGLLGYVGRSSPTLADLMRNIARYRRVFSDVVEINPESLSEDGMVSWHFNVSHSVSRRQYVEFSVASLIENLRRLTQRDFQLSSVGFLHPRNSSLKQFERFSGCDVSFGGQTNVLQFKMADLNLPLVTADDVLHKILTGYCTEILAKSKHEPESLSVKVERLIADHLVAGEAKLDFVAREMGLSSRSLSRQLAQENTSFKEVIENLRFALAKRYLDDSGLPITEIAFLLGYSDTSSFSTAFKKWSGASPKGYRA